MKKTMAIAAFWLSVAATLLGQTQAPAAPGLMAAPAAKINKDLPKWLKFSGDYRSRFEGYSGGSFKSNTTDEYMLSRLRLGLTIQPTSWLKAFVEGYDARAIAKNPVAPPFENTWDIRQAYVELGDTEKKMISARVGRQDITFGDQRLVGSSLWTNAARSFDAVRGTLHYKNVRLDAFAASVVNPTDGSNDHHLQGNNLHGLYGAIEKVIPGMTIEPYIFWRLQPRVKNEAGITSNLDEKVPGIRIVGKTSHGFDYGLEMVREFGSLGSDGVSAWAGHWVVGRTIKQKWAPRYFAEYNYASGDGNAKDATRGTFDQLYPTGHDKYGLADQVGWRNVHDARFGVETKPRKNLTAALVYNDWHLASATDALYNAPGNALFRSATGTAGTHIGQELEISGTWTLAKPLVAGLGYSHIFPGQFLKNTTAGVGYNFQYVMFSYKF